MIPTLVQLQNLAAFLVIIVGLCAFLYYGIKVFDAAVDEITDRIGAAMARHRQEPAAQDRVVDLATRRRQLQAIAVSGQKGDRR